MIFEKSCGFVVYRESEGVREYLLVSALNGKYGFPKGHVEAGETEHQTAIREVEEETAVKIRITSDFCEKVHYSPMPGVQKEVVYFMAMTDQKATHPHNGEIADVEWVPLDNAERSLTHENDKIVLRAAMKALEENLV
jgi:8-oxo-dGTP pyrophosphatase MutT (NUDIX family)